MNDQHHIRVPDLELPDVTIVTTVWHVDTGQALIAGDCLLEVLAGEVAVEIATPVDGSLVRKHVAEDDIVQPGDLLATVRAGFVV